MFGELNKAGIDQSFRDRVQALLSPGKAAVVIMSRQRTEDKFTDALKPFGGRILKTSLSGEQERESAEDLGRRGPGGRLSTVIAPGRTAPATARLYRRDESSRRPTLIFTQF